MWVLDEIGKALSLSFTMFWEVLWPLALGFLLSTVVETLVSKQTVSRALGRDAAGNVALAAALGAASSSCSYAAVAVARTLFRKGATLGNAVIFEFASTNLVFELGLVLLILLGWQFVGAELAGGVLMVVILAIVFRLTLSRRLVDEARVQAERGLAGRMEGHAAMDMSVTDGPLLRRAFSARALTSISQYFFTNIYSLWTDLVLGFLIAGALGAWVPDSFWSGLFQPMSSTRSPGFTSAHVSSLSVEARPPGWITRFPSTARNAYGSRARTCALLNVDITQLLSCRIRQRSRSCRSSVSRWSARIAWLPTRRSPVVRRWSSRRLRS
jgi:uncharacterized membrane protein YraQ (UPF0718 family)